MSVALIKQWRTTEVLLERACAALPSPDPQLRSEFETTLAEYRHFLSHNELELAFDALYAAAKLVPCRGGVWRDLERAAEVMALRNRLPDLRQKFLTAVAGKSLSDENG